jgi:site-specific DNA-methyltransferase (adenine-specific)
MKRVLATARCTVWQGEASSAGQVISPGSIDALISDPPGGIGFMGKAWDSNRGGRDAWVAWLAAQLTPSFAALKPGAYGLVWALPRTSHWTAYALETAGFEVRDRVSHFFGSGFPKSSNIAKAIDRHVSAPGTAQSAAWAGWGTALKPACEDWWLVQKPFRGTYADNVLAHGVGGLNIDGCRIGDSKQVPASASRTGNVVYGAGMGSLAAGTNGSGFDPNIGRWPAHLVLSHSPDCGDACVEGCAVRLLDEQSGFQRDGVAVKRNTTERKKSVTSFAMDGTGQPDVTYGSGGGASRFFYIAKASTKERSAGLDGVMNVHPTVKSVTLMRWLIRLITPPNGLVLDPFAGTGTTGIAAIQEGHRFVGIELGGERGEYIPVLAGRLYHALGVHQRPVAARPPVRRA